jgi:hypothetical protein
MLPGFYAGLDPATAAQAQGPKWMRRSVRERGWFWDALHDRLSRLANRIDAEARGKIMGAVHARIPMLTVDEREALPKWEAEEELEAWQSLHTGMRRICWKQPRIWKRVSSETARVLLHFRMRSVGDPSIRMHQRAL